MKRILLVIAINSCAYTALAQQPGSVSLYGGTVTTKSVSGGIASDASETLYIGSGQHVINGVWKIYSKNIVIDPNAQISGSGSIEIYNPQDAGGATGRNFIDGNNMAASIDVNIVINNASGVEITALPFPADLTAAGYTNSNNNTLYVGKNLNLAVDGANIRLGSGVTGDLRFDADATISNYSASRMVITNNTNTSHMVKDAGAASFFYPVGKSAGDYTPAFIAGTGAYHVSVTDYSMAPPVSVPSEGMGRVWHIYGAAATSITLNHNSATNGALYIDTLAFITRYQGSGIWSISTNYDYAGQSGKHTNAAGMASGIPVSSADSADYLTKASDKKSPLFHFETTQDFNVVNINDTAKGDLHVNDDVPAGTTYGTPVSNSGNPGTAVPAINSDGTYTFTSTVPGVYMFSVSVCEPGQAAPCPTETLAITVLNPTDTIFPPVVNPDNATGSADSTIKIPVLANDDPTSPGGSFGIPAVSGPPSNGITTVNPDGTISYTPTPGFTGVDTFTYTVCDTAATPDQCRSAKVTVTVLPPNAGNTVAAQDDYVNTYGTVPATGNVLLNDNDPESGIMTVTPQSITAPQGTFSLLADGSYTFMPASGFTGPLSFVYTVCDNGQPQACDQATLHILVDKAPDYTPLVFSSGTLFSNSDTVRNFITAIYNVNNTINRGQVKFRMSQSLPNKELIIDPAMTAIVYNGNNVAVSNTEWDIVLNGSFYEFTLKPGVIIPPNGAMYVGFKVKVPASAPYNQIQPVTASIIYQSGGDSNYANNNYTITITKN